MYSSRVRSVSLHFHELFPRCAAGVELTVRGSEAGSWLVARQQELTQKTSLMIPAARFSDTPTNHLLGEHSAGAAGSRKHQLLGTYAAHL